MAPRAKARASSTDEKTIPSIVNAGYFSDYYLGYRLDAGLADLYRRWDAAEKTGDQTARSRIRSLGSAFDAYRVDASLTAPGQEALDEGRLDLGLLPVDGVEAQEQLNDKILEALGWKPHRRDTVELTTGEQTLAIPVAHHADTHSGTLLLALDGVFSTEPAAVVAGKEAPAGRLLRPLQVGGKAAAHTALQAAQLIFTADDPPSYLLIVSGGSITLLDRDRWGEGVFIGANLDNAIARHDDKPKGELAAIAALFCADSISPGVEAQSVLSTLLEKAASESAGVSKDLRHGMRRSVELLANAVVADMRERQKVAWTTIDPADLTRQCLRYLYRIVVLLFAEARPELGILPADDPDYQSGYSIARLRDTALVELQSDHARKARHIQQSLDVLFRVVNEGHKPDMRLGDDSRDLEFPGLRSTLFGPHACPLADRAYLPDEVLQQVIAHLCFTRERAGANRESVSYSTLGVNQLGAVYEGLMAYSGFIATEPLFEIDKDGDPDNGSWVIPVTRADEFPDDVFLKEPGPDGTMRRVQYREGEFVYRLSGRDRQRSASYYTPEILTEFTVRHALDVYFEENPDLSAADLLELTICEPALGSGAFANEAVNQVAARYLKMAQDERGETIDADHYQRELQKVKAHFAVNQVYGVDLNQTAVDLAEVGLWLNCMHPGLDAPWFGARLRRGNSLIGTRRATYSVEQVASNAYTGRDAPAPTDQPLADVPAGSALGIHHFLVPGQGWGGAADAAELKELAPEWASAVKAWRKAISTRPNDRQLKRLDNLARRVEDLWRESLNEVAQFWGATRQHVDVWGHETPPTGVMFGEESIRRVLHDPRSASYRLRTVMDAWCSLWVWSPEHGTGLPLWEEWISALEEVTRVEVRPFDPDVLFADERELDLRVDERSDVVDALRRFPWLAVCDQIAERHAWFHWELEFSPVFVRGGFDVVVGNPPWTKLSRTDTDVLIDAEPLWGIEGPPSDAKAYASNKRRILSDPTVCSAFLAEAAASEGTSALLGSSSRYPQTCRAITNLYLCFMEQVARLSDGVSGLLHQESFYEDARLRLLRESVFLRLRRHWHFVNELLLFAEVDHHTEFGVHICASERQQVDHLYCANLLHPRTVDQSLLRRQLSDRSGELPGKKDQSGGWDLRPHAARIIEVDTTAMKAFAAAEGAQLDLTNPPRPLRLYIDVELQLLEIVSSCRRVDALSPRFSSGIHESSMARPGRGQLVEKRVARATALDKVVLKGPNLNVANPYYQEANEGYAHSNDNRILDLTSLDEWFLPRTILQPVTGIDAIVDRLAGKDGWDSVSSWRLLWPEHVSRGWVRVLQPALIPPGVLHGHSCMSASISDVRWLARLGGLASSVVYEVLVRMLGTDHMGETEISGLPIPGDESVELWTALEVRVMRLNALTRHYAHLWEAIFVPEWTSESSVIEDFRIPTYRSLAPLWTFESAVRSELARWVTLIEVDALVSLLFDLPVRLVAEVGRVHLGLLANYDRATVFDANGRKLSGEFHNRGAAQTATAQFAAAVSGSMSDASLAEFAPPFDSFDRWRTMTTAYWAFVDRYGLTPPDLAERPA